MNNTYTVDGGIPGALIDETMRDIREIIAEDDSHLSIYAEDTIRGRICDVYTSAYAAGMSAALAAAADTQPFREMRNPILHPKTEKIVLTYGTFDLLHYGHIEFLRRAAELGDKLYVGVSSDKFNVLKGKTARQSATERLDLVAAVKCVDLVFSEETWSQKISDIITNGASVLAIGDDWTGKFDYLKALGVEVVYLPRTPLISSSAIREMLAVKDYDKEHGNENQTMD